MPIDIPNIGRDDLSELFHELGFKVGAEVGVKEGEFSEALCRGIPGLTLFCIDAWRPYQGYRDHTSQARLEMYLARAMARLLPFNCRFIRQFSLDAVKTFAPGSLDFVYLDANHEFQHVVNDICEWSKVVRPGGIVAGHDFTRRKGSRYLCHVPQAVTGYTDAYDVKPWFVLGSKEIREGETRDQPRSWMWVRPEPTSIAMGDDQKKGFE
jgi:SAM-dependent methyltransferase